MPKQRAEGRTAELDPLLRHSRREATLILGLWACCFLYTISFCYLYGYTSHEPGMDTTGPDIAAVVGSLERFDRDPGSMTLPLGLGIPDWVFYGVVVPWLVCILATVVFCMFVFTEDDLSAAGSPEETDG